MVTGVAAVGVAAGGYYAAPYIASAVVSASAATVSTVSGLCQKYCSEAGNFFDKAQYSTKVLNQMKNAEDIYHAFPELVKTGSEVGKVVEQVGADGRAYSLLRIPGAINGVGGNYTFIKDVTTNIINHRFFEVFRP